MFAVCCKSDLNLSILIGSEPCNYGPCAVEKLLNEVVYDVKNYADGGKCYHSLRHQPRENSSHHTKAKFNKCFIIHATSNECTIVSRLCLPKVQ